MHFFKILLPKMAASKMAASDPSHFADFEQIKKLVVILQTLNNSKN